MLPLLLRRWPPPSTTRCASCRAHVRSWRVGAPTCCARGRRSGPAATWTTRRARPRPRPRPRRARPTWRRRRAACVPSASPSSSAPAGRTSLRACVHSAHSRRAPMRCAWRSQRHARRGRAAWARAGRPRARVVVHAMKRKEARGLMTAEGFEAALEARGVQVEVRGAENATVRTPRPQHRSSLTSGASLRS